MAQIYSERYLDSSRATIIQRKSLIANQNGLSDDSNFNIDNFLLFIKGKTIIKIIFSRSGGKNKFWIVIICFSFIIYIS